MENQYLWDLLGRDHGKSLGLHGPFAAIMIEFALTQGEPVAISAITPMLAHDAHVRVQEQAAFLISSVTGEFKILFTLDGIRILIDREMMIDGDFSAKVRDHMRVPATILLGQLQEVISYHLPTASKFREAVVERLVARLRGARSEALPPLVRAIVPSDHPFRPLATALEQAVADAVLTTAYREGTEDLARQFNPPVKLTSVAEHRETAFAHDAWEGVEGEMSRDTRPLATSIVASDKGVDQPHLPEPVTLGPPVKLGPATMPGLSGVLLGSDGGTKAIMGVEEDAPERPASQTVN